MSYILGFLGGLIIFTLLTCLEYFFHIRGIGTIFGIWFYIPFTMMTIIVTSIVYSIIRNYFKKNENQIMNDLYAFLKMHKTVRYILLFLILVFLGYCSYKIFIYLITIYSILLSIIFTIGIVVLNVFFLGNFSKISRAVAEYAVKIGENEVITYSGGYVTEEKVYKNGYGQTRTERHSYWRSGGTETIDNSCYTGLIISIFIAFCYFDYKYMLSKPFELDSKVASVAKIIDGALTESQVSTAIIGNIERPVMQQVKNNSIDQKNNYKKNKNKKSSNAK